MGVPGKFDEEFVSLYKEADQLYAKAWGNGYGFSEISAVSGDIKWGRIYSALLSHKVIQAGKSGRSQPAPVLLKGLLEQKGITHRQWANAYDFDVKWFASLNNLPGGTAGDVPAHFEIRLFSDFPQLDPSKHESGINGQNQETQADPVGNIQVEDNKNGTFTAVSLNSEFSGTCCIGKNYQMAVYHLVGKIKLMDRVNKLRKAVDGGLLCQ